MWLVGALDWTIVSAAIVAGVFSCVNTALGFLLYRYIRVPSARSLGDVVERTHSNTAVTAAAIPALLRGNGEHVQADEDEAA